MLYFYGEIGVKILVHQDLHIHLVCTCTLFSPALVCTFTLFAPAPCFHLPLVCTFTLFAPAPSLQKTAQTQRSFLSIFLPLFPFNGLMFSTFLLPIGNAVKENFTFLAMSVLSAMHLNFKSVHCSVSLCLTSKSCFLSIR